MNEPPAIVTGVRVMRYCQFERGTHPTGRRTIHVGGKALDLKRVRALIIGENLADGSVMLMHCTSRWKDLASFFLDDMAAAEASAAAAYTGAPFSWQTFRELTKVEQVEVERTRAELNALLREFPTSTDDEA